MHCVRKNSKGCLKRCTSTVVVYYLMTVSTISTIRLFVYISCSHQDKNVCHGITAHTFRGFTVNTRLHQSLNSVQWQFQDINFLPSGFIACKFQRYNINDLYYDSTLLLCTCATKEVKQFWGCGQFLLSLLSTYFLTVFEISVCEY